MPPTESDPITPVDSVISAVADEHRRVILRLLNQAGGGPMGLDALAERVAEQVDNDGRSDEEHRYQVRIALHQIHLPKLSSCGLVRYDTETKEARSVTGELSQELLAVIESYETTE